MPSTNRIHPVALVPLALLAAGCAGPSSPVSLDAVRDAPESPPAPARSAFTQDVPGTAVAFEMMPVPGGAGIEPFYLARTEVTWDVFDVFVYGTDGEKNTDKETDADAVSRPSQPYVPPDLGYGHAGYAAISVSFKSADAFCSWLTDKTGRHYRLPSEAEWRHACALGDVTPETMNEHAWFDDNADFTPHPVGEKKPDALGIHDLWGNVGEWCVGADDQPVSMGGSFQSLADEVGCAARAVPTPDWQVTDPQVPKSMWWLSDAPFAGFRVVCEGEIKQEGTSP